MPVEIVTRDDLVKTTWTREVQIKGFNDQCGSFEWRSARKDLIRLLERFLRECAAAPEIRFGYVSDPLLLQLLGQFVDQALNDAVFVHDV